MSAQHKKSGLGRGFDTLIPTDFDTNILHDSSERIQNVFVTDIYPNPEQPRRFFDDTALSELAASIKRHGILQPLIVSPGEKGSYIIVAGERRWRASQIAGLKQVPVIVRARKELEQLEVALIENVQRVDLSPLEQAVSIERLHREFNLAYAEIAKRLGKADTTVSNIVRLLQLPDDARLALQNGEISEGHARAIVALKQFPEKQPQLLEGIIKHGWSVRQAEQFVVAVKQGIQTKSSDDQPRPSSTPETERLSQRLHAPVSIRHTARGGRLEIRFTSEEELQRLLEQLG